MKLKTLFLVCVSITSIRTTFAFISEVYKQTTLDEKEITLYSDLHKQSPAEKEQIDGFIDSLQECKNSDSFHVLMEKASPINTLLCKSKHEILYTLDNHLKHAQPELSHVTLENIEVRHAMGAAYDILKSQRPYDFDRCFDVPTGNAQRTIGTVTFQDIINEFEQLKQSLSIYYLTHTDNKVTDIYAEYIERATQCYEQFQRNLAYIPSINDTVLDYAKTEYDKKMFSDEIMSLDSSMDDCKQEDTEILANDIQYSFTHLFDLNLLKAILTSTSHNLIVFAGGRHVDEITNMLSTLKATTLYYANNATEEMSQEEIIMKNRPVTPQQMREGFNAKSKQKTSRTRRSQAPLLKHVVEPVADIVSMFVPFF